MSLESAPSFTEINDSFQLGVQQIRSVPFDANAVATASRYKLYGLMRQTLDGNCNFDMN